MNASQSNTTENPENLDQYLEHIANLDVSPKEKLELLRILLSILSYFVDQAFNVQTDQITLASLGNVFDARPSHVTIGDQPENQTGNVETDGVDRTSTR